MNSHHIAPNNGKPMFNNHSTTQITPNYVQQFKTEQSMNESNDFFNKSMVVVSNLFPKNSTNSHFAGQMIHFSQE